MLKHVISVICTLNCNQERVQSNLDKTCARVSTKITGIFVAKQLLKNKKL